MSNAPHVMDHPLSAQAEIIVDSEIHICLWMNILMDPTAVHISDEQFSSAKNWSCSDTPEERTRS